MKDKYILSFTGWNDAVEVHQNFALVVKLEPIEYEATFNRLTAMVDAGELHSFTLGKITTFRGLGMAEALEFVEKHRPQKGDNNA
jgi:hypothetical protein